MKVIGILGRLNKNNDGKDVIIINNNIKDIVISNGFIPLLIPPINSNYKSSKDKIEYNLNNDEKSILESMVDLCDGLIIPGGEYWYDYDVFVTEYALKKDIPILGICLGMQLIASILNNKYSLKLNDSNIEHRQINKLYVHEVIIKDNTLLKKVLNTNKIMVNSRHKCNIDNSNNYTISAISDDGIIEAIEVNNKRFVLGLQWHPEDMYYYDEYSKKIFDYYFNIIK